MSTRIGTHLDRYQIDAELGRGAMGVVYRARDLKLDRTVAIKMISLDAWNLTQTTNIGSGSLLKPGQPDVCHMPAS